MEHIMGQVMDPGIFFFLAIGAAALFTFLSIATWTGNRVAERDAYYKAEMMKKIAEIGGERNPAIEYLREQERIEKAKMLSGLKLGGFVQVAAGVGIMVFLKLLIPRTPIYLCGLIVLLVGFALLAYAFWFAPKEGV